MHHSAGEPALRSIPLEDLAPLLDGQVDLRHRPGSLQPIRAPVGELSFYDPFTRWVATCTAGVRLRCSTTSRALRLTGDQRLLAQPTSDERRGAYDLYVDGELFARDWGSGGATMAPETGALVGDETFAVAFNDLPAGDKLVELWLPQSATFSLTGMEIDEGAVIGPAPDTRRRLLFHGSSITHCMEAEGASSGWPAVAARLAGVSHQNLGWAGSCLLSGLAARIIRDTPADAIILKLGINVWADGMLKARTFLDSAHAMISIIRERHPTTPILVVSPIYSPGREDLGQNGGMPLQQMRQVLQEVVAVRAAAGDQAIRYLSGLELFGEADAQLLPDDLHPNTEGYRLMGERFHALALSGPGGLLG
jgi:lysophospholipase L1-like esterase